MARWVLIVDIAPGFSIEGQPPTAWVGSAYSYPFVAMGGEGAITWSLAPGSTLPAGWTLSAAGLLGCNPVVGVGIFDFRVRATDAALNVVDKYFFVQKSNPLPK